MKVGDESDGSEFNLLDEPWIRVMLPDFTQKELLTDVLLEAHEIRDLAGELPAQDTAVAAPAARRAAHGVFQKRRKRRRL